MNGSGAVIDTKDPVEVAMLIDRIVNDSVLKDKLIKSQRERLKDFSYEEVKKTFVNQLQSYIKSI